MSKLMVMQAIALAIPAAVNIVRANAGNIAKRLNVAVSKIDVDYLVNAAKDNPIAAAFIAFELFGAGSELLTELGESDSELRSIIDLMSGSEDVVAETESATDITMFTDEFRTINLAEQIVGGRGNLHTLRKALSFSDETFLLHLQVSEMAKEF